MTVAELIAELQKMDPNRIVVCQEDSEGNGYRLLMGADDNAAYLAETTWSGQVYRETKDRDDLEDEDMASSYEGCVPCVVLFPVN